MRSLSDYFGQIGYTGPWQIGDRVIGKWNQIPFVGTVGNDRMGMNGTGPEVTVHLDLPFKYQDKIYYRLIVKHRAIKAFK